jgi:hypothetical protein
MTGKKWRISLDKNAPHRSPNTYNCSLFKSSVIVDIRDSVFINGFTVCNVEYITVRKSEVRGAENIRIENKNLRADESLFYEIIVNGLNKKVGSRYASDLIEGGTHRQR